MNRAFHERRRQQFATEAFSSEYAKWLTDSTLLWQRTLPEGDTEQEKRSGAASLVAGNSYQRFSLRYTAGEPIEDLRTELSVVVEAYERYQSALAEYEQIPKITPFSFKELGDYERCMQLIGLCYLLHRRDLLPRIAALQDPGYSDEDTLYEDLLCYELPGRFDVDALYWREPYEHLVHAMYRDTNEESLEDVQQYVKSWYPAFKHVPWHDGHLRIRGTEGDYFGYWAFEAGAVAYLIDLDDSSIDHLIYPRDLVNWARENKHLADEMSKPTRLRGLPGETVPRTGTWRTLAIKGEQGARHFNAGDSFPETAVTKWGSVIWYLDQ